MKKSILLSGGVVTLAAALGITALASTGTYAEGANTEVNLIVNPVLSITATESIDLSVTPTAAGTFVSDDIAVNVITNSATGYKLYLSSNSAETALTSAAAGTSIPTVASAATSENMANNTWGYSLSEAFNPVPASSAPEMIKETSTASVSTADVTTVTVGAKVDTSIPSGVYSNTLLFTATAKDDPSSQLKRNYLSKVATMQDPNIAQYCRDTYTPTASATTTTADYAISGDLVPEAMLTDSRDGKSYLVRKLADGNCWMTQNLDLEGARTLTSDDTDLNGNIVSFEFPASIPYGTGWNMHSDDHTLRVIEPSGGDYIINPSGKDYTLATSGEPWEHRGNYYNWYVAVAGTTLAKYGEVAASSICPKGWQLPNDSEPTDKSWSNLLNIYHASNGVQGAEIVHGSPINEVRAGYYYASSSSGSASTIGELSYYWTNHNTTGTTAYAYRQMDTYSVIHDSYVAQAGLSIRCVARQSSVNQSSK